MKKLIFVFTALILIAVGLAALVIFKAGSVVTLYKPTIEQKISTALGAQVKIGAIDVSVLPSLHLAVSQVSFANQEGKPLPISLQFLKAGVHLMPLILSRKIEVSSIELVKPQFTLLQTSQGISVEGLAPAASTPASAQAAQAAATTPPSGDSGSSTPPLAATIEEVIVSDGAITLKDTLRGSTTSLKQIQATAGIDVQGDVVSLPSASVQLSVSDSPPLSVTTSVLRFHKQARELSFASITLASNFGTVAAKGSINLAKNTGGVELSSKSISLDTLASVLTPISPAFSAMKPSGTTSFALKVSDPTSKAPQLNGTVGLRNVAFSPQPTSAISETNGDISLAGTALALKLASENLKLRYQNTPLAITLAASLLGKDTLDITKCTVKGWGGTTTVVGSLSSPQQRPLRIDLSASDLAITALLETFKPDLSGRVSGTITSFSTKLATAGPSSDLATALQGPGSLRVTNGVIKGTNLAAAVLAKVDSLPFLSGSLRSFVPPQFDKQFSKPDTEVRDLRADFSLRKGALGIGSFSLTSDIFSLDGDGSVAFTGEVNLKTTIYFTKEFSQALAQQGRDVKNVLAADGRLIIPLTIQGRSPALVLYPNIQKIIETGAAKALQDKALSALEKALGGKSKKEGGTDQKGGQNNLGKALRGLGL